MVKHVLVTGATQIGEAGLSNIVYSWGQNFDSDVLAYDFLIRKGPPQEPYRKKIEEKGGRIFFMPESSKINVLNSIKWTIKTIKKNQYDTVHINASDASVAAFYVFISRYCGINHIFVHSHSSELDMEAPFRRKIRNILHRLCRPYVLRNTELCLACSRPAADWMYGDVIRYEKKYRMICNGVNAEQYLFDAEIRWIYREKIGVATKRVWGNVGRFAFQKNHDFLIDIFMEGLKRDKNAVLMLVGSGDLEPRIREKVKKLRIEEKVLFMGQRHDIPQLLWAMDVLVMPSRFEGLPITMVEAQMASLPCVVSRSITQEASFTDDVVYVDGFDAGVWSSRILEMLEHERNILDPNRLKQSGFNIESATRELQSILAGNRD